MEEEKIPMELTEARAIVYIPENAVEVEINATIYDNGSLIKVGKTMTMKEIQEAFRNAEENYIEDDDEFVVTEKGREWLESLNRGENDNER